MLVESLSIIAIIFAMAFIFVRAGKKAYATGLLPLLVLPVTQICMNYISNFVAGIFDFQLSSIKICIIFLVLIITCILIGICGMHIKGKLSKSSYYIMCGLFTLILAMIYVLKTII